MQLKIKNSSQSINPDSAIIIMCIGLLIACPLRIFQMLKNIDPATGFFNNSSDIMIYLLYAVLAAASLLILALTFLSARVPASLAPQGRRIPLAVSSFIFAATLLYDGITTYFSPSESTATIVQNADSISTLHHAHAIFAFISSCYFIVFFISYISGNGLHKKLKILSLAPLVWAITKVLERITVIISIVRVSELLLELCAFVFLMIFFMTFARVVSEVNSKGSMWSVIACGSVSALFILTFSIPRLILMVTGNTESIVNGYPLSFADLGCVLFVIMFILTVLRCGYATEDVEKMNEEIAQENEEKEMIRNAVSNVQSMTENADTASCEAVADDTSAE